MVKGGGVCIAAVGPLRPWLLRGGASRLRACPGVPGQALSCGSWRLLVLQLGKHPADPYV